MRWSSWNAPLVVLLAWTGLAWGQRAAAPAEGEHYLLVGDPGQKCRVLASWRMEDGRHAYDVQALSSGEIMTLYEAPDVKLHEGGGLLGKLRMRIGHWSGSPTRPPGLPAPPAGPMVASASCRAGRAGPSCTSAVGACDGGMPPPTALATTEPPAEQGLIVGGPAGDNAMPGPPLPAGPVAGGPDRPGQPPLGMLPEPLATGPAAPAGKGPTVSGPTTAALGPDVILPAVPLPAAPGSMASVNPPASARKAPTLADLASQTSAPAPGVRAPVRAGVASPAPAPAPAGTAAASRTGERARAWPPAWCPTQPGAAAGQQAKQGDWGSQWGRPAGQLGSAAPVAPAVPQPVKDYASSDNRRPASQGSGGSAMLPDPRDVRSPGTALPPPPGPLAQLNPKANPSLPASRVDRPGSMDPLANPDRFLSPDVTKKLNQQAAAADAGRLGRMPPAPPAVAAVPLPPVPAPVLSNPARVGKAPATKAGDPLAGRVPLGVQSVYQATLDGAPPRYVPVPIVTIPQPKEPPKPPTPKIPEPPKGPDPLANAFSPPAGAGSQAAGWRNAFSMPSAGQAAPAPGSPQTMPNPAGAMAVAPYPMAPGMMPNPRAYAMAAYPYPRPGYGGMPLPPPGGMGPYGAMPAAYYGGPMARPVGPAPAAWPQGQPAAAAAYANPAMDRPGLPVALPATAAIPSPDSVQQMAVILRSSLYPSQREWSADYLAGVDWRKHPQVVPALVTAAREDPAPSVRAACVHGLVRLNVSADLVGGALQGLRSDPDAGVRTAAEQALARLAPAPAPIQPVGGPLP